MTIRVGPGGGPAGGDDLPAPADSSPSSGKLAQRNPQPPGPGAPAVAGEGGRPDGQSPPPASIAPPTSHSVGFTLSSLGYAVAARFRATLAPLQLEPREFALLRTVASAEGRSQQAVGGLLQIPASRMVAFVDALEGRGLLERRHNPLDRRTRELHLTDRGRSLLERALALAVDFERELLADLSLQEREQLLALLQRVGLGLGLRPGVHAAHLDGDGAGAGAECAPPDA
ncbi:MAG: winged helix-turn-helix transcriptional regulator [Actinobacteria bacterium]|nr:MAG: winged helix-turn-helix transcriptional regulator [Actinomycetota bacterium]